MRLAHDTDELREHVQASFAEERARPRARPEGARPRTPPPSTSSWARLRRVRPIPRWRLRLAALATQAAVLFVIGSWMMSTDEVTSLAAKVLRVHPLAHVATDERKVAVVVHAPARDVSVLAYELAERGIHVSFADDAGVPTPQRIAELHDLRDELLPEVPKSSLLRWPQDAGRPALAGPGARPANTTSTTWSRASGLSVGQLVLARTDGATRSRGRCGSARRGSLPQRPMRAGDVLVVELDGSAASVRRARTDRRRAGRRGARRPSRCPR